MNTISKILSGVVIASGIAVVAIPTIYNNQVNQTIENQKNILYSKNITMNSISNNDTFFHIKRTYELKITDIALLLNEIYPNMKNYDLDDLKKAFNNTTFEVNLDFDKYPVYHKNGIKISLKDFNEKSKNNLEKSENGKKFLEFIHNKGIELLLDIDKTNISEANLKDINLEFTNTALKIKGVKIIANKNISMKLNTFKINSKIDEGEFKISNISYNLSKQNDFNYKTSLSINNIHYTDSKNKLEVNEFKSNSTTNTIVNNLNIKNNISINNFELSSRKDFIKIDKLLFNTQFNKLDLTNIKKMIELSQQKDINSEKAQIYVQKFINNGLEFKISPLSINKIDINIQQTTFNIQPISLTFNTNLSKNSFKLNDDPSSLINNVTSNLKLTTTTTNINLLKSLNPMFDAYVSAVTKIDNQKATISLSYKNGNLTSNGKKLF